MKRRIVYIISTIICFILCALIVLLLSDYPFVRGFMGDVIVMILIYSFIKVFVDVAPVKLCISIMLFSFVVEFSQYLNFIHYIGLEDSRVAKIIVGTTFDYRDLLAYVIGAVIAYVLDSIKNTTTQ